LLLKVKSQPGHTSYNYSVVKRPSRYYHTRVLVHDISESILGFDLAM